MLRATKRGLRPAAVGHRIVTDGLRASRLGLVEACSRASHTLFDPKPGPRPGSESGCGADSIDALPRLTPIPAPTPGNLIYASSSPNWGTTPPIRLIFR